jgi:hypothetical protein
MSKTIFLGDTHGRNIWKDIIRNEIPDRVVFIGDYFDSYDKSLTAAVQMYNMLDIIDFKKQGTIAEVIMLIGNHDYHYYPGNSQYSGYQWGAAPAINQLLYENKHHLQMCYQLDDIICTHAGVGYDWLVNQNKYNENGETTIADFINDLYDNKPHLFEFYGRDQYGDSKTQTPIWIRPSSLMSGNKDTFLKEQYIQIVGHTSVDTIDMGKATGGRYYFIDALEKNQEYLIYEDGVFSKGTIWNQVKIK